MREETITVGDTHNDDKWQFNERIDEDLEESEPPVMLAPSTTGALLSGNYLSNMVSNWVTKLNLNEELNTPSIVKNIGVLKMNEPTICHKMKSYKTTIEEKTNQYKNMAGLKALNPTSKYL